MAENKNEAMMVRCLECDSRIYLQTMPDIGQLIICDECHTQLEIVGLRPLACAWVDEAFADIESDT